MKWKYICGEQNNAKPKEPTKDPSLLLYFTRIATILHLSLAWTYMYEFMYVIM